MSNFEVFHVYDGDINAIGGIETYIKSCLHAYPNSKYLNPNDPSIFDKFKLSNKIFHFHDERSLVKFAQFIPSILLSVHNHNIYCPSGSRYAWGRCCEVRKSFFYCTAGHLLGNCGSKRPQNILSGLKNACSASSTVKRYKVPLLANSHFVKKNLVSDGIPESQVRVLHYGHLLSDQSGSFFENKKLTPDIHKQKRILFVGRIVPVKGLAWLLKALKLCPSVQLDVAGDGWSLNEVRNLALDLGLESRISWHGKCDKDAINKLLQQSFTLVFPSLWPEPAGLVSLEAYDQMRPVIASKTGGIVEHVENGVTGMLVPPGDVLALANIINDFANDFEKSKTFGINGYELLKSKFTFDQHVKSLNEIYSSIV
jgi:glycosyltransferase involved in cell wall biosynthesis